MPSTTLLHREIVDDVDLSPSTSETHDTDPRASPPPVGDDDSMGTDMRTHMDAHSDTKNLHSMEHHENSMSTPGDTEFHVTGFKQFFNVPVNPTELVVNALPSYTAKYPLPEGATIRSTNVFTVAAKTTLRHITSLYNQYVVTSSPQQRKRTVFVHLGVNMSISKFVLEVQARNEATFSCPDELGWTPIRQSIEKENSDITLTRRSNLDVGRLARHLAQRHFDVDVSYDAGRFVCNWIYYNSLKLAEQNESHALFVHVPSTAVVPLTEQVRFVAALLDTIATSSHSEFWTLLRQF